MYNRGYYGYIAENVNIKTKYTIEFTRNKEVLDMMEKPEFDFDMLDKKEFVFLEDAISCWNTLCYDSSVLHIMLYEQIILNDEVVLEQCKDEVLPTVLDRISRQKVKQAEDNLKLCKEENEKMKNFLAKYGINAEDI